MKDERKKNRTLLIVDYGKNILIALTRVFRKEEYSILQASNGKEEIEFLKEHSVAVIISDQRIPEMTGAEFISDLKIKYPDTIRINLSGYTDKKFGFKSYPFNKWERLC